ncbi:extracellular solute-binding protein [Roseospira goensis]|uniref:Microcin C transport system substrate-binding protein n=1 Tax=Roseospira goensis TaxID=391922 RepID=A0A7W6RYV1_9PROT|nr:extracellular solute-binding protein [Roseospira goensis]MBB4285769.1 microcin C transport system substrate-binding protein [Roseospira goensis]
MRRSGPFLSPRSVLAGLMLVLAGTLTAPAAAEPSHAIAMHGTPKYGPDFPHFDYVNPDAPKGGTFRLAALGGFDTLNPFTIKGESAAGLGRLFDTLMVPSADEPFTKYGLVAESIETPEDRSWVTFRLNPAARFHDGTPITAEDVLFSFETLRTDGAPLYRFYYADVAQAEALDDRTVTFTFSTSTNRELPLILGQLPVLPKHDWEGRDFAATTLEPPLGSGPYRIADFEPGRTIRYERVEDYWARDLPVSVGQHNFGVIEYDYYRDATVAVEALKAGEYDFRAENIAKVWATAYDGDALEAGHLVKLEAPHDRVAGMQGFVMNMRRPVFADPRVREALAYAFDFQWANRNLFFGQYTRTRSYFDNSPLAATGVPEGAELALLEPYRDQLPPRLFTEEYTPPAVPAPGEIRANLRTALGLLREAGWSIQDGVMTHPDKGPLSFEILLYGVTFERVALPFVQNLERLGVKARVRTVDTAQFLNRINAFDYDMAITSWGQSDSPGNEQREFWSSATADVEGSRNLAGIADPVVDALIERVIQAHSRAELETAVHALDRVLQWSFLVVPHWHIEYDRLVFWDKFGRPAVTPSQGTQVTAWWVDPAKAEALAAAGVLAAR